MRISKRITALGAVVVAAAGIAGCGSGIPGDSVASVAGNPITTQAFNHWMYVAAKGNAAESPGAPVIVPTDPPTFKGCLKQVREQIPSLAKTSDKAIETDCKSLFTSLSSQVLGFLIDAYWYQADAYKLHIKVTNAQVTKALAAAKKSEFPTAASYATFLTETGQTQADINYRIRINQVYKDLLARNTKKVTAADISTYFAAHPTEFGTPAERNIRIVRTNSESQAKAALAALKAGQSWDDVAKKYSVDTATKNDGGLLTDVTNGEEEHALNEVAFSAPLNTLEGPVHGTFGWYVVEVIKITPATHETIAKATALIKQLLNSQNQTAAENVVTKNSEKNWGKQTLCRAAYSMSQCHGYTAPKTTTTTTPSTTTPATATSTTGTSTAPASTTSTATTSTTG
jgi:foldase protein PrsA